MKFGDTDLQPTWKSPFLLAVPFATRLILGFLSGAHLNNNYQEYGEIATSLLRHGVYSYTYYGSPSPPPPTAMFTPGYPLLLAAVFALTHAGIVRNVIMLALHALAGAAVGVLVARITRRLFGATAGTTAWLVMTFYPFACYYDVRFFAHSFAVLAFLAAFDVVQTRRGTTPVAALVGLLAGLSVLVEGVFLPMALLLCAGAQTGRAASRREHARFAGVALAAMLLTLSPWLARNAVSVGAPVLKTTGGMNLWLGNHPSATGTLVTPDRGREIDSMPADLRAKLYPLDELRQDAFLRARAIEWIRQNPGRYLALSLRRARYFWLWPPPEYTIEVHSSARRVVFRAMKVPLVLAFLWGLALFGSRLRKLPRSKIADGVILLSIPVLLTGLYSAVIAGSNRFFAPVVPFLVVFAALGISSLGGGRRRTIGGGGRKAIPGAALLLLAACGSAWAGSGAAEATLRAGVSGADPAPTGLCAVAHADGETAVGGVLSFRLSLSNAGPQTVDLGPPGASSAWLIMGAAKGSACFTGKIRLEPEGSDWPPTLAPGGARHFKPVDAGGATAYPFDRSLKFTNGYLATATGELPPAAGKLRDLVTPGKTKARWMVALPRATGEPPLCLWTAPLEVTVGPPRLAALSPDARRAYVADLLRRFDRNAWSAKEAHDEAANLGPAILPDLIAATNERRRPEHARLWLATAVADIPDERSVAALTGWLDDPQGGVRGVVAYHGPKQKSGALDQAIISKAKTGGDAAFTSYALLGLMVSQSRVSDELMQAGIENADPRIRATAAKALAGMANDRNKSRLQALLQDPDEHVRAAARKVLAALKGEDGPAPNP